MGREGGDGRQVSGPTESLFSFDPVRAAPAGAYMAFFEHFDGGGNLFIQQARFKGLDVCRLITLG
jgi:hypothetical protein